MPLVSGNYPPKSEDWLLAGSPSGSYRANMTRRHISADVAGALTTQVMLSTAIALQAGDIVTSIAFRSGATAAGTPTNYWVALYSSAATPALLAQSADQLTAAWGANTTMDLALSTAQLITTAGIYYAALMVKATTPPSLLCDVLGIAGAGGAIVSGQKVIAQTSGSSLVATAPATIATPTTVVNVPYCVCH